MTSPASRYQRDRVLTATPAELVGMIYDVAVRSVAAAGTSLDAGDRTAATAHLVKAQDAVVELRCGLDNDCTDPEAAALARRLDSLYEYVYLRLVRANLGGDRSAVEECAGILRELRDAWRQACLRLPAAAAR